jgi:hypothetical protein
MLDETTEGRHRREAERFRSLAAAAEHPTLRQLFARIAELHQGIANDLAMARNGAGRRN